MPPEHKSGSQSPRSSSESQPIKRKPLPIQGPSHLGNEVVDQLEVQPPYPQQPGPAPVKVYEAYNPDSQISQPPPPPPHTDRSHITSGDHVPIPAAIPVARKPVPLAATGHSAPRPLQPLNGEEPIPPLPPRSYLTPRPPSPNSKLASHHISNRPSTPNKKAKKPFVPFSLTLIRRDPTQGQQWNVGQVASFQLDDPENLDPDGHAVQQSPSISVHLENSGYAKFRGTPSRPPVNIAEVRSSLDGFPAGSGSSFLNAPPQSHSAPLNQGGFDREVMMSYTPSFTSNIRNLFGRERKDSKSADEARAIPPQQPQRPTHTREASTGSVTAFFSDFDGAKPVITKPSVGLRPRGYVFMSPWEGRCEFVTGNAGRSLRCNHILPQIGGAAFNPLVDGDDGESGSGWPVSGFASPNNSTSRKNRNVRAVSELRFNLPSSELLNSRQERDRSRSLEGGAARARDQLQTQFNKVVQSIENHANGQGPFGKSDSDDDFYDEDGRLNLSLGQEKAGGGNRGKRAKMGKLIIAEDGLKMLDLVVAANIGIWWAAWEKSS